MPPFSDDESVRDSFRREQGVECLGALTHKRIVFSDTHPKQLDLLVGRGRILEESGYVVSALFDPALMIISEWNSSGCKKPMAAVWPPPIDRPRVL
jgi:hypothetical protein